MIVKPDSGELIAEATALHKAWDLDGAARLYRLALDADPDRRYAQHMLGVISLQQGRLEEAISLMTAALQSGYEFADAHNDLGYALHAAHRIEEAIESYSRALEIRPDDVIALQGRAMAALAADRIDAAISDLERVLVEQPRSLEALVALGDALRAGRRFDEAIACYDSAIETNRNIAEAHNNRGNALAALDRYPEAVASYDNAIELRPDSPEVLCNRGNALFRLRRYAESAADFRRALELRADSADAYFGLGNATRALGDLEGAFNAFAKALALNPALKYLPGDAAHAAAQICDWASYESFSKLVRDGVAAGRPACFPFILLAMTSDPALQLACAASYARTTFTSEPMPRPATTRKRNKIRLAYLSADFREHAVAFLIAELIEIHDRSRFEVIGVSFGSNAASPMRSRLQAAFDRSVHVQELSDAATAALLRDMEVDIAIDLMGYTQDARMGIMARRPAPIQVNFLGYTGTTGAEFIDYIVGDWTVIPAGSEKYYSEKVVRLPDSFQANDSTRRISDRTPSRSEVGLRPGAFVFCCFNNSYKIRSEMFDVWMRLLGRVEGSQLWMIDCGKAAERNLRSEAERRNVDPTRLVFAPRARLEDHLARQRLADLFLDSLPYNAHTGTSDALWAGLPVLTCPGRTFASRVAASLLLAMDLPELVMPGLAEYEARALELARNPAMLAELRRKIALNRSAARLFDTQRFRRHIEHAYLTMWEMHRRGESPRSFAVRGIEE